MIVEEKKSMKSRSQNLILENRERLSITGVLDVESFNEENAVLDTELGILIIKGDDLHINKLNLENAELVIEGDIVSCSYTERDERNKGAGFFAKMFR